ncbi:FAD:protein FMN transferase [Microbacterium thalassium]|uniref:FAD:protein FMN transferase n=2 Tax=Microbacterium thalassium TaxID=362649 RepID=A0A7X0FSW4_9MICO|nr:FAD:protein FMN transferase [Microbacterium thalassium]MBB6393083.1 thiamine biosynthesis lipoprotein [Microbacterium thalassium]
MGAAPGRQVEVRHIMGTAVSIHALTAPGADVDARPAMEACFAELREADRVFSPYREDSDISRIRRGELTIEQAAPDVAEVAAACSQWEESTQGRFSARWRGGFDPTGYVKGWAVERAAVRHLAPLVLQPGVIAAGINAGGDIQLFTADDSDWVWHVGIADPGRPGEVVATVDVRNGAVATSGSAERGRHIIDPRTGEPVDHVVSATVVGDGLAAADVWATAAAVAGFDDLSWLAGADTRMGILLDGAGRVRRWTGATPVSVQPASVGVPA